MANAMLPANLKGTLAGVAATFAVGFLSNAGYLSIAATALGIPEATIGVVAMAVIGGAVNFGVTHIALIKSINDLYGALPTMYAEYPGDPLPIVNTNLTSGNPSPE
jgi:hypothetical protein